MPGENLGYTIAQKLNQTQTEHQLKLSQDFVAKEIGLGRASISNIENGKHQIPLSTLYILSVVLKYDIQLLLPTYQELQEEIKKEETSDIDTILRNEQINDKSRSDLKDIIKKL